MNSSPPSLAHEALAELVEGALGPIAVEQPALFPRLVGYVLDGTAPEALLDLRAVTGQRLRSYFSVLGSDWSLRQVAQRTQRGVERSPAYEAGDWRVKLYVAAPRVPHEAMVRLGTVLFTVSQAHEPMPASTPGWLAALVLDVFHSAAAWRPGKQVLAAQERKIWGPEYLESLALAAGATQEEAVRTVLGVLFEKDTSRPEIAWWDLPSWVPGAAGYTVGHAAAVPAVLADLTPGGVQIFLRMVEQHRDVVPHVLTLLASLLTHPASAIRARTLTLLRGVDDDAVIDVLLPLLTSLPASRVGAVAELLVRLPSGAGAAALRTALEGPLTGKKAAAVEAAVDQAEILRTSVEVLVAPKAVLLADAELNPTFVEDAQAVLDALVVKHTALLAALPDEPDQRWRRKKQQEILSCCASLDLTALAARLSPHSAAPGPVVEDKTTSVVDTYLDTMQAKRGRRLVVQEEILIAFYDALILTTLQQIRLLCTHQNADWFVFHLLSTRGTIDQDLRALEDALRRSGMRSPVYSILNWGFRWDLTDDMSPDNVWPFFAEHTDILEAALLGQRLTHYPPFSQARALDILEFFPQIPVSLLTHVTDLAVRGSKTVARQAQDLLGTHPGAREIAQGRLTDTVADSRRSAAAWLGRLSDEAAVPALRAALAREKQPVVRATVLAALDQLGEDTRPELSPAVLLAEARAGLRAKLPAAVDPGLLDRLPACTWADGTSVPDEVVRWWVVFAIKLKDPAGAGLLPRYVSLLSARSQAELGRFLLDDWIRQDTLHPSDEACRAFAATAGPSRYALFQRHKKYYEAQAALSLEEVTEQARREQATAYVGSATAQKGVLALTGGVPGTDLADAVSTYLRQHPGRRSQAESLTTVLSLSDHVAALQLLLSIARRFRQKSVQEHAARCIEVVAAHQGWTTDELADRTVPTAGFEDDGTAELTYGDRSFVARLTPRLTVELATADGTVVKALPAARAAEDAAVVKEAKAQLASTKKELKQVLALQTGRLYEAMCTRRGWSVTDWANLVHAHPVMRRLVTPLIWVCETEDGGHILFRSSKDGALVDAEGDDVTLSPGGVIRLAHAVVMSPDEVTAWKDHLADFRVVPLIDQLSATAVASDPGATSSSDRQGWMSDTFTLRSAFTKRGYTRGGSGDGGWFDEYVRDLPGTGQQIVMTFSGSMLPEENIPAAMGTLAVRRTGRGRGDIRLTDLSPVLLAEAYQDYLAVASVGTFDADWEKKSAW